MKRIAAFAAVLALIAGQVAGQQPEGCPQKAAVHFSLQKLFAQTRVSVAIISGQNVIETWVNRKNMDWTIVQVNEDGKACILATGKGLVVIGIGRDT